MRSQAEIRRQFQDKPNREELIRRGAIDPSRTTTMGGLIALHKTLAQLRTIREGRGISLTELAERSGMSISSLSRIEGLKNEKFTFETLARYAAALGLNLEISVSDPSDDSLDPASGAVPAEVGNLLVQTHRQLGVLLDALGSSPNASGLAPPPSRS